MSKLDGNIPSTMLAANIKELGKPWVLERVPVPFSSMGSHDILIKVAVASFCHTDMMVLDGIFHEKPSGMSGSHEPSGTIVALGPEAAKTFSVGDRVIAIGIRGPCGDCMDCNGPEEFQLSCKFNEGYMGISSPGAFQEFTLLDERFTARIPESLSFVQAAPLTCAGCTSWRAIKRTGLKSGAWLGIVGSGGGLGHLAIQFATKMGIKVIGVEARDVGLELTRKAGANEAVDIRKGIEVISEEIRKIIGPRTGRGDDLCDASLILSDAKSAVKTSMMITKSHGLVVQVAQPKIIEFPFEEMIFRDIRIIGSNLSSRSELVDLVQFVVDNGIQVETEVHYGLESLQDVYDNAKAGKVAGKSVIVIDKTQVEA